jgi:hypothetical protein
MPSVMSDLVLVPVTAGKECFKVLSALPSA